MKIVIDARNMNSTTGRYAERLVHFLEELDHKNDYTILILQKDIDFYKPTSPRFKMVGVTYDWYSFSEQFAMNSFLTSLKADLVHFTMPHHPVFYRGRYITTFHDLILMNTYNTDKNYVLYKSKQFVGRFAYKAMMKNATHIITPSNYTKDAVMAFGHIMPEKVSVVYNGCDVVPGEFEMYKPFEGKRYIMYLGQQSDYKNIRRLMQAHQQLRQNYPDLLLVLVGRLSGKKR